MNSILRLSRYTKYYKQAFEVSMPYCLVVPLGYENAN